MKIWVVKRVEEHDDYVEKAFVNQKDAEDYCNTYNDDENEYSRVMESTELVE